MDLCKYKDVLGKPGKGVHSYRFFNVAVVDVMMTLIASFLISYFFQTPFLLTCIVLFAIGIFLHRLFCVRTTVDKILFPTNE